MSDRQAALRAGAAVLLSGVKDATLLGARAYVVPTEDLPRPSWDAERVSVLLVERPEGRNTPFVATQPGALTLCCAGCWLPRAAKQAPLKSCARCMGPRYCTPECQRADWKRHKAECKRLCDVRATNEAPATPLGADKALAQAPHAFPWRFTLETPAMLSPFLPCFLTAHPQQRFTVGFAKVPEWTLLPLMPLLREDLSDCEESRGGPAAYHARVPTHYPNKTVLGVVGECVLTDRCVFDFVQHFDNTPNNKGSLFRWPPAASVWLDFADGETIKPSKEPLLMVVQLMAGIVSSRDMVAGSEQSACWSFVTRVQPRLMKRSGLRKLCGTDSLWVTSLPPMAFYPDFVRLMTAKRDDGRRRWTAADLWRTTCAPPERIEAAFEAVMREEQREINTALGIDGEFQPVTVR